MKTRQYIAFITLLVASAGVNGQTVRLIGSKGSSRQKLVAAPSGVGDEDELLEKSREAGLLTDWHLIGRYGQGRDEDVTRRFSPEKEAAKLAAREGKRHLVRIKFELVFPEGIFMLPGQFSDRKGVFYAESSTYLMNGGDWNVYLECGSAAVVFVDGRRVVSSAANNTGVQRGTMHLENGYHSVLVKFVARAAPFRVAVLPPNSGSRRKNNTPYLKASPAQEDMLAAGKVRRTDS